MATPSFNNVVIARAAAALYGIQLGSYDMANAMTATTASGTDAVINAVYGRDYGTKSHAAVASMVVANLGITGALATEATAIVTNALDAAPKGAEGATIASLLNTFAGMTNDPNAAVKAAAIAFNTKIDAATTYAQSNVGNVAFGSPAPEQPIAGFTLGFDELNGTSGDNTFNARILDNSNTLQSGDIVHGGTGTDTLFADMGASQAFAVTPETDGVEVLKIRGQSRAGDSGDNNVADTSSYWSRVDIDAERMSGLTQIESNNSRADVIVEDVRIEGGQKTSSVTIAMVETDPGHVDFGVYFDQYSLRNQTSNTSSILLQVIDTVAAAAGKSPLLNSNYGAFTFTATDATGVPRVVTLGSKAIQDAQTYADMAAAFQIELDTAFGAGAATATVGDSYTVPNPDGGSATGQYIVLTTKSAVKFDTSPVGSGWLAEGTAPAKSNFYTNFQTGSTKSTSLVTSPIILDDVGRGSTGGDLVVGGLSVGDTSGSKGVQRFEIEVRDNSKLESINSTNNTLREVTIKNGATSSSSHAYVDTVVDAGNLTVNGASGANGANVTNGGEIDLFSTEKNVSLPGAKAQIESGFGFSDVRLIDGSAMTGMLSFSAQVTDASVAKYLNKVDIQAVPSGDNVRFDYLGGTNADTLYIDISGTAAASRNTIVAGREDFTFTALGNAGDDDITVMVASGKGGAQAWYNNQRMNKNITIDGGSGDDTINKPGSGDAKILGGTGNDTIYADNSGQLSLTSGSANGAGALYAADAKTALDTALATGTTAATTDAAKAATLLGALHALDLVVPAAMTNTFTAMPNKGQVEAAILAAVGATTVPTTVGGPVGLTLEQQIALEAAYGTYTAPRTIVEPTTFNGARTLTGGTAANAADPVGASEFAAGNALLASYVTAAEAARVAAAAADANSTTLRNGLIATGQTVFDANLAVNNPDADLVDGFPLGTAVKLATLNAVKAALVTNASDTAVLSALNAALKVDSGNALYATLAGMTNLADATALTATEAAAMAAALAAPVNAALIADTTARTTLTNAVTAYNTAVAANAANAVVNATAIKAATTAALTGANTAVTTANKELAAVTTLKALLTVGVTDADFNVAVSNAATANGISAGDAAALNAIAALANTALLDTSPEKWHVDEILAEAAYTKQLVVDAAVAKAAALKAVNDQATVDLAKVTAAAAEGTIATSSTDKAVFVVNTANQLADTSDVSGVGYVLTVNDERNFGDLKSDANNSYKLYNGTVTVTFKGIAVTVPVQGDAATFTTNDLQINQAIKTAVNAPGSVMSKLLAVADGPANTLIFNSLIDGKMVDGNLTVTLATPKSTSGLDLAAAAKAYATDPIESSVLAVMAASKATFDTKGDYTARLAESGVNGTSADTYASGAASTTTSDNTITGGDGDDVIVLGTTVGVSELLSSNDTVVFAPGFGNDTIVNFKVGSLTTGGDKLNLSALGGNVFTSAFNVDKSVTVATESAANDTAAEVAALFTDAGSAAATHVYLAVDSTTNIAKVYTVTDAAGTTAPTAVAVGTIDLADSVWLSLTAENFV